MLASTTDGVLLNVRVIPRARSAGLAGTRHDALLVRLTAPPVDGAANAQLIEVLAKTFGLAKRYVTIAAGERSRTKRVRLQGIDIEAARSRIARLSAQIS
ncbi:MAG: DUF167 domain-containing protein [Vicinamibacterales bacterium]